MDYTLFEVLKISSTESLKEQKRELILKSEEKYNPTVLLLIKTIQNELFVRKTKGHNQYDTHS